MSFVQFLNSPAVSYVLSGVVVVLLGIVGTLLQSGIKRLEGYFVKHLSPQDALKVNEFLNAVDYLTALAVQDANSRIVIDAKANGLFSKEVADSVKQAVIRDVMNNLGPLQEKFAATLGPIENIVAQAIEKHVLDTKPQTNVNVQLTEAKSHASAAVSTNTSTNAQASENANTPADTSTNSVTTTPSTNESTAAQ